MAYPRVDLQGVPGVVGAEINVPRGARAGVSRIRLAYASDISPAATQLTVSDGNASISFDDVIPDLRTVKHERNVFRHGKAMRSEPQWTLLVHDRRKRWENVEVYANVNERWRDCTIRTGSKKEPDVVLKDIMNVLGEQNVTVSSPPTGIYPQFKYEAKPGVDAISEACKAYAMDICYESGSKFTIHALGTGSPPPAGPYRYLQDKTCSTERGPKIIYVTCAPTLFQSYLYLEAVGMDTDGEWKRIDDLSYKPSDGWEMEWPTLMSGVDIRYRDLALRTVFRCYRVMLQSIPLYDGEIGTIFQIELDDVLVEMRGTDEEKYEIPAFIEGSFWPHSDHPVNSGAGYRYNGPFEIDKENRMVIFDHPVFKLYSSTCVGQANIMLATSYRLRDWQNMLYVRKQFSIERSDGSGVEDISRDELWETRVNPYSDGKLDPNQVVSNESVIQQEAQTYLNIHKQKWDGAKDQKDVVYSGINSSVSCNGVIEKVSYRVGYGLTSQTRASMNCKHLPG